jgi:hypothetical protein
MTPTSRERDLALPAAGDETGFWDDQGRPAPWPDDFDEWRPVTDKPPTLAPAEPPF